MKVSEIMKEARDWVGQCSEETIFTKLENALTVLANKNYYQSMTGYVDICTTTDGRQLTLPRDIETPLAVNIGGQPAYFRNKWYEFHLNGNGSCTPTAWTWDDTGFYPVVMDIKLASYLIYVADLKTDLAAQLRAYGYDQNGQWVMTQNPDGSFSDGMTVPINLTTDFPNGIIVPDTERILIRDFSSIPITTFGILTGTNDFTTGASAVLSLYQNPLPSPLVNGASYFIRWISSTMISLHTSRSGALTNTDLVTVISAQNTSQIVLTDSRIVSGRTKFTSSSNHNMNTGTLVTFTAVTLPTPVSASTDYYANVIDATNFTIHPSAADAVAGTNTIDVSDSGTTVVAHAQQPLYPITVLDFSVNHNFQQGDAVSVANSGGTLPSPLIAGITYYVRVISATRITLHSTLADATNNENPIILTDNGAGASIVVKTTPCSVNTGTTNNINCINHGLTLTGGDFVQFTTTGTYPSPLTQGTTYIAGAPASASTFSLDDTSGSSVNITTLGSGQLYLVISRVFTIGFTSQWQTDATSLATQAPFKFSTTGVLPSANPAIDTTTTFYLRKINDFVVELYTTAALSADTAIRLTATRARASNVATLTTQSAHSFTTGDYVSISGVAETLNGVLTTITIGAGGAGWTTNDVATITDGGGHTATAIVTAAAGAITGFSITNGGAGFTVAGSLTVAGAGSGGTFTVATVTNSVSNVGNSYNSLRVQITVTGASSFTYASTGLNEPSTADTAGQVIVGKIIVTGLGAGSLYLTLDRSVTVAIRDSYLNISDAQYLTDGSTVQFTTTGTLPSPLATNTDYLVYIVNGLVEIRDTLGVAITITAIGSGTHTMSIARRFGVTLPTSIEVLLNVFEDGDAVTATSTGTLPTPLAINTTYYVRRVDDSNIELYATEAQADNLLSTTGRITLTDTGTGSHTFLQTVANIQFSKISRIFKSVTNGFTSLYAWDNGRSSSLTLVGRYYPDEQEPRYRRIKIGACCSWIRMRYRVTVFKIRSQEDFLPINNKMAILLMLKSLELRQNNYSESAEDYEAKAIEYMDDEERSKRGPEVVQVQFNAPIWTNPFDRLT